MGVFVREGVCVCVGFCKIGELGSSFTVLKSGSSSELTRSWLLGSSNDPGTKFSSNSSSRSASVALPLPFRDVEATGGFRGFVEGAGNKLPRGRSLSAASAVRVFTGAFFGGPELDEDDAEGRIFRVGALNFRLSRKRTGKSLGSESGKTLSDFRDEILNLVQAKSHRSVIGAGVPRAKPSEGKLQIYYPPRGGLQMRRVLGN